MKLVELALPPLVAISLVAVLAACKSDPEKVVATTKVCLSSDEVSFRMPKNATLASGVEYAEMVRQQLELDTDKPENAYAVKLYNVFSLGTKCKGAKNESKCMQSLSVTPSRVTGMWQGAIAGGVPGALMIRATKGGEVATILNPDDVKALLLPVDTAEEAAVVALGRATASAPVERTVKCDGPPVEKRGDGSWVVTAEAETCEGADRVKAEQRVRVAPDGKVTVLGEKKLGVVAAGACGKAKDGGR